MKPSTTPRSARGVVAGVLAAVVVLAGCSDPTVGQEEELGDPSEDPIASTVPDPSRDALVVEIRRLGAGVERARAELATALEAEGPQRARAAGDAALDLLVADAGPDPDADARPLFPAESLQRDDVTDAPDQLTNTLTAARDLGGSLGNRVVDLLRDPVAGDLGAWQRDAAGVLASIDDTTREATDLEGLEAAVTELPGLGTQAVAWAQLTSRASDLDSARAFAERGLASLDVITVSLDLLELGDDPDADPEPGGDDASDADDGS